MLYIACYIASLFYINDKDEHHRRPRKNLITSLWKSTSKALIKAIDQLDRTWNPGSLSDRELRYYRITLAAQRGKRKKRYFTTTALMAMAFIAMGAHEDRYDNDVIFDTDSGKVGLDNRCSACISPYLSDFETEPDSTVRKIKGFGGSVTGGARRGTLSWKFADDTGRIHAFRVPNAYYVPQAEYRLLSPQHWAQTRNKDRRHTGVVTNGLESTLYWRDVDNQKCQRTIPLGRRDNVSTFRLADGFTKFEAFCTEIQQDIGSDDDPAAMPAGVVSDDESSISSAESSYPGTPSTDDTQRGRTTIGLEDPAQQTNPRTSHSEGGIPHSEGGTESTIPTEINFEADPQGPHIVEEEEEDKIPDNHVAELLRYHQRFDHLPMAKLQEMARQNVIPRRLAKCALPTCSACLFSKAEKRPWRQKSVKNKQPPSKPTRPGQVISVDQLKSPTPGLVAQMRGIPMKARYEYATVFVDHYSGMSYIHLQKTQDAEETVEAKIAFERYAATMGVKVLNYHGDNGIFRANLWVQHCAKNDQGLTFAGVGAHHTNGMAERRIKELQNMTRASMVFAAHRWSNAITTNLWPYAMRLANESINAAPRMSDATKRSPLQIFSNSVVSVNKKHFKPFGCPVYVLDESLQTNRPHGKWKERTHVGIYLGRSPHHPRNVALVLSPTTGLVSPQFHVKFDSSFSTVKDLKIESKWQLKAGFVTQREHSEKTKGQERKGRASKRTSSEGPSGRTQPVTKRVRSGETNRGQDGRDHQPDQDDLNRGGVSTTDNDSRLQPEQQQAQDPNPEAERIVENPNQTRSGRVPKPVRRLIDAMETQVDEIFCLQSLFPDTDAKGEEDPLLAYKANADPDTMYMHEAMREPDKAEFIRAMVKEVEDQMGNGNFTIVKKSTVPKGQTIFRAVWQMKRKRDILTRKVKKWKARLNLDGSTMTRGRHYEFSYAPVARWNSIRMILSMAALKGWHTTQIDYVLAFPQAPVEREMYMEVPRGFEIEGSKPGEYVLKIHRNIYGNKAAGRVWNKYLTEKLIKEVGFVQSKTDECVFFRGSVVYVLYTDDSILAGPSKKEIDRVISDIKKAKLDITVEGDIQDFLGVHIDRKKDGTVHLTQPHLIESVLNDLRMTEEELKTKATPASSSKILSKHPESQPFDKSFHYRRVIGKLNYLEKGSRSDIAYIVHQCARYVEDPKREHGDALRWLGRYLAATKDKGTIYRPMNERGLEVFVDASFCQDWVPAEADNRDTARSRHGYYIMYAGCPIQWKSQLQTEVTLSSTESEYTGLSYALRDAIPMMRLLQEFKEQGFQVIDSTPKVHCKVFEDNSGALEMAREHKYRPRTKHLNVKLHHFRDYVIRNEISVHKIDTKDQLADILTKPVNEDTLTRLRPKIMGW